MNRFAPQLFFDLDTFAHPELFQGVENVWEVLGRIKDYALAHAGEQRGEIDPGAHVSGDGITIGAGSRVEAGATLQGPVWIGENSLIRSNALVRGGNVIGSGCTVGQATELKNCLLLDGAAAPHFNYVGDSVLGAKTNLGAGTKLSNLRFDKSEITLRVEGELIPTGRRKFGAILGDGSQTGCNAVLNPGTVLGRNVFVWPTVAFGGYAPDGSRVGRPRDARAIVVTPPEGGPAPR